MMMQKGAIDVRYITFLLHGIMYLATPYFTIHLQSLYPRVTKPPVCSMRANDPESACTSTLQRSHHLAEALNAHTFDNVTVPYFRRCPRHA